MRAALVLALAFVLPAQAQTVQQRNTTSAAAGTVRVLDKISGETKDIEIARGETEHFKRLHVRLGDCRYPTNDPNSEAYGWLDVAETHQHGSPMHAFSGWMFASSPALNAMEHPRYDVWMLRCKTQ